MSYVIKNLDTDMYVADMARSPTGSSYTNKLQNAKTFNSRESAQRDCCGNERVTTPNEEMS